MKPNNVGNWLVKNIERMCTTQELDTLRKFSTKIEAHIAKRLKDDK